MMLWCLKHRGRELGLALSKMLVAQVCGTEFELPVTTEKMEIAGDTCNLLTGEAKDVRGLVGQTSLDKW